MTADQYRAALASLGLSQLAAGRWLGVSPKTAQNYARFGPSAPAAVAVRYALKYGVDCHHAGDMVTAEGERT